MVSNLAILRHSAVHAISGNGLHGGEEISRMLLIQIILRQIPGLLQTKGYGVLALLLGHSGYVMGHQVILNNTVGRLHNLLRRILQTVIELFIGLDIGNNQPVGILQMHDALLHQLLFSGLFRLLLLRQLHIALLDLAL